MSNSVRPTPLNDDEDQDPLKLTTDRAQLTYTSCYCEENVWKLCEEIGRRAPLVGETDVLRHCHAVFISNPNKSVPIWYQRSSPDPANHPVVWDYHVILVYDGRGRSKRDVVDSARFSSCFVYDLDTSLPFPTKFAEYYDSSFRNDEDLKPKYRRFFRVIPSREYVTGFASDRRHMRNSDGSWKKPPPPYPPIVAADGETNNIDQCIDVTNERSLGRVVDANELRKIFG